MDFGLLRDLKAGTYVFIKTGPCMAIHDQRSFSILKTLNKLMRATLGILYNFVRLFWWLGCSAVTGAASCPTGVCRGERVAACISKQLHQQCA